MKRLSPRTSSGSMTREVIAVIHSPPSIARNPAEERAMNYPTRPHRRLAIVLLVPFGLISAYAVYRLGQVGILAHALDGPAGWQLAADLVVALVLILAWLIPTARREGRSPWPWAAMTLFPGSLLYLVTGKARQDGIG